MAVESFQWGSWHTPSKKCHKIKQNWPLETSKNELPCKRELNFHFCKVSQKWRKITPKLNPGNSFWIPFGTKMWHNGLRTGLQKNDQKMTPKKSQNCGNFGLLFRPEIDYFGSCMAPGLHLAPRNWTTNDFCTKIDPWGPQNGHKNIKKTIKQWPKMALKGDPLELFGDPLGTKMAKKRPSKRQPKNLSPKMLPKNALPLNIAPEIPRLWSSSATYPARRNARSA